MNLLLMQGREILEEIILLSVEKLFSFKEGIHLRLLVSESEKIPYAKVIPMNILTPLSPWTILHLV